VADNEKHDSFLIANLISQKAYHILITSGYCRGIWVIAEIKGKK